MMRSRFGFAAIALLTMLGGCGEREGPLADAGLDADAGISDGDDGGPDAGDGEGDGGGDDGGSCLEAYPGQVLITEVMVRSLATASPAGCYVELYNAGLDDLRMEGWLLEDGAGQRVELALAGDRVFAPGQHPLLAFEPNPVHNGGFEPDRGIVGLDLESGQLRVLAGGIVVDAVDYAGADWAVEPGVALNLDPGGYDYERNDQPAWWCPAWVAYGAGDLGTPGRANSPCDGAPDCGNTVLEAGEQCDDGNDDPCDGCLPSCRLHTNTCGDGFRCDQEACDDGNQDPCDGCLPDCSLHTNTCGDGITCPPEACDDGGTEPGDGCSADCRVEGDACPQDMVLVPADPDLGIAADFCMDRYEASRPDATAEDMGADTSLATSRSGVLPWYVNPVSLDDLTVFEAACSAAGKRLCGKQEWFAACTGPEDLIYSFGDVFDLETCNCVDTFCDDHCLSEGIVDCNTGPNCGYQYYCFHVVPTGEFPACATASGAYDVNGNVWEVVPSDEDPRGFEVRGGAFNCASASARLQCTYNAGWNALFAGFRCCRDAP